MLSSLLTPVHYSLVLIETQKVRAALCHIVELASYICAFLKYFCVTLSQHFYKADIHQSTNIHFTHHGYL
jgi:hypothetical protein